MIKSLSVKRSSVNWSANKNTSEEPKNMKRKKKNKIWNTSKFNNKSGSVKINGDVWNLVVLNITHCTIPKSRIEVKCDGIVY